VEDSNKHIIEETVRQVGHLPELYKDARPEKYKIQKNIKFCRISVGFFSGCPPRGFLTRIP